MQNKELLRFINEARKKGFSDAQIKELLIKHSWPVQTIENVFKELNPKFSHKNQICLFLSDEIISTLDKRAKKNMLTLSEQIEDILRRSCIRKGAQIQTEKIDDLLIKCFSRSKRGRKK